MFGSPDLGRLYLSGFHVEDVILRGWSQENGLGLEPNIQLMKL